MRSDRLVWIKGAGDIGSAVAHRLRRAGWEPVLADGPAPLISRRRMAFGSALHEGEAALEGLRGVACGNVGQVSACLEAPDCVPVLEWEGETAPAELKPAVVVDARMRKKATAPEQIGQAPLVVGIGPGFEAGLQVHAVVESNWGEALGRVVWRGAAMAYTGKPRAVGGFARERYLYAPHGGVFHTGHDVTARVEAGQAVGRVDDTPLRVEISGVLRGLVHDGVRVAEGAKLVEVDPRGEARHCIGIGERPARIAEGVLSAILKKRPSPRTDRERAG